jgi:hypothetical protein
VPYRANADLAVAGDPFTPYLLRCGANGRPSDMVPTMMRRLYVLSVVVLLHGARPAEAGNKDLEREIKAQQSAANDLANLDTGRLVQDEITLLRTWLDEAASKLSKDQGTRARESLDRCVAQADLIRVKLATAKLKADATAREQAARDARDKVKKTQKALEDAIVKKKAMEMNAK